MAYIFSDSLGDTPGCVTEDNQWLLYSQHDIITQLRKLLSLPCGLLPTACHLNKKHIGAEINVYIYLVPKVHAVPESLLFLLLLSIHV